MNDTSKIIVVKRDGLKEDFSYDKLIASILKAGVPMEAASSASKTIQDWVRVESKNGEIASSAIRDKIIEVLSKDFSSEADSYQAFVKG